MIICTFEDGGKAKLRHVVVHAIVEKYGALLLGKRAGSILESGKWGLPSGFMDRDETAGQCIVRELLEETGWECEVVSLFRINTNPSRPHEDRQNISIEFICKAIQKVGEGDHENSKVEWIPIDNLIPPKSASWRIAFDHGESIQLYLQHRKSPFTLPLLV